MIEVEADLVPLRVAASVAYVHITDRARRLSSQDDLAQVIHLVAIALSTVAPIRRADGAALTDAELRELFYRPLEHSAKLDLDSFFIRRADLKKAMTTLKEARVVFGRSGG